MQNGSLVELGTREQILTNPEQAYTRRLLAAVPVPDPDRQQLRRLERDVLLVEAVADNGDDDVRWRPPDS